MTDKQPLETPPLLAVDKLGNKRVISEKEYFYKLNAAHHERELEKAHLRDQLASAMETDNLELATNLVLDRELDIGGYDSNGLLPIHYLAIYDVSDEMFDLIYDNTSEEARLKTVNPRIYIKDGNRDLYDIEINQGDTVLHIAAREHNPDILQKFCRKFNAYRDLKNSDNSTPLQTAIDFANFDMVNFATSHGAIVTEEIVELARGLMYSADFSDEAIDIYTNLATKIGINEGDIEAAIAEAKEYNNKSNEEEECSDKDLSDDDSRDEEEDAKDATDQSKKRRRENQEGAAASTSKDEDDDYDDEPDSPSPSPSDALLSKTPTDKKRKR